MVLFTLNDFTYSTLINDEITNYSTSVKQDFSRCIFENSCSICDIYSVTMCTDINADDMSEFEMNESVSVRKFVTNIINKRWQFD